MDTTCTRDPYTFPSWYTAGNSDCLKVLHVATVSVLDSEMTKVHTSFTQVHVQDTHV